MTKRYRTIKRDFWEDEKPFLASRDARLLFLGMLSHADDHGLLRAIPLVLKGNIFAYDETTHAQIAMWLVELHEVGLIRLYGSIDKPFAHVVNFQKHQRQRHIQPATCPMPGSRNSAGFQPGDLQAFTAFHCSETDLEDAKAARKVEVRVREKSACATTQPPAAALSEQVSPPTTESTALDQAITIFLDCSRGGIDESMWRSQIEQHRSRHLGAPIERYVDAAMAMRAKYLDSNRPFTMNSGWAWFQRAWTNLAADEHRDEQKRVASIPASERRRTAADVLAAQNEVWGESA